MAGFTLNTRSRVDPDDRSGASEIVVETIKLDPERVAVVIIDMWDTHFCISAAKRVDEMAPRMNEVITSARKEGALIIHSPCGCVPLPGQDWGPPYSNTPQRRRAEAAPQLDPPIKFDGKEHWNAEHESPLPPDPGECSCHPSEPACEPGAPQRRQIETIEIAEEDAVTDQGQEFYNLLKQRDIEDVIVMGVHTNACVLSQPYGIRRLVYQGKRPLLCRDLTDSFHRYSPGSYMGHFEGTGLIVEHIERYWCPTITSDQIAGGEAFRFRDDRRE
ncbi:MAG: cysteine hydrolase family protein [Gemmatimonadetes bacterium]|jgi:nicotinamidase-related amidase|nr:cysteine hydrolase family protein [Gemmatimonadota bacterium]MBT7914844.1 cysteine hydrolase family protein [Candidatus Bathyarchaeota archaeon]